MITVRHALKTDVSDIARIHASCWQEAYSFLPAGMRNNRNYTYRKKQWNSWFSNPVEKEALFVLLNNNEVIGFGFCCQNKDDDIPDALGELHAAYVMPEYRGGISGPILLREMMRHLADVNLLPASLWAWQQNPIRITYGQWGFVRKIRRDRTVGGYTAAEVGYITPNAYQLIERLDRVILSGHASGGRQRNRQHYQSLPRPASFVDEGKGQQSVE